MEGGSDGRRGAAAGLGLTLALGAAPVVAVAEGVDAVASGAQTTTTSAQEASEENAVYIGEQGYANLRDALLDAEEGDVIKVAADNTSKYGWTGKENTSVTIDLNGHTSTFIDTKTITVKSASSLTIIDTSSSGEGKLVGSYGTGFIVCNPGATLTVEGGAIVNKDESSGNWGAVVLSGDDASLVMKGGSITGKKNAVRASGGASVSLSGGIIVSEGDNSYALTLIGSEATISEGAKLNGDFGVVLSNSVDAENDAETPSSLTMTGGAIEAKYFGISGNNLKSAGTMVNISGGTIDTGDASIYWPMEGTLRITDGTISGSTALEAKMGTIVIKGGSFSADGEFGSVYTSGGSCDDGSAIKLVGQLYGTSDSQYAESPNLSVTISGATVSSEKGNAVTVYNAGAEVEGESIPTCSVTVEDNVSMQPAEGKDGIRVTSAEAFAIEENEVTSGNTTVTNSVLANAAAEAQNAVSKDVEGKDKSTMYTLYSTLGAALENASTAEGGQADVTLLRNVTEDVSVPEGSSVSLNLNDKTLTGGIENNGTLELAGSGEVIGQITGNEASKGDGTSVSTYIASVGESRYGTLVEALAAAANADGDKTVELLADYECAAFFVPAGVTLDGNDHTITCNENYTTGAFITVGEGADDVTIRDVKVSVPEAEDANKHAIQFYKNDGGTLDGVTVNGGNWTSVIVNGATDVTVKDSVLNPNKGAYANIEYAMGGGVTTVPSLTVDGVKFKDGVTQVWADDATVTAIRGALPGVQTNDDVIEKIAGSVTNKNDGPIQVAVRLEKGDGSIVTETVQSVTNPPYNPGGSVSSGEQVKVSETDGGKVSVTPTRADEGDEVTVTATPDEGQEVREVEVTDEDGEAVTVEAGEKDGEYVFEMPDGAVTVTVTFGCDGGELCPTHSFADVDQSAWYHDAVDWAVEGGLMTGYGHVAAFGVSDDLSRAQLAKVLWNAAGQPEADPAGVERFSDCSADDWFAEALSWAASEGIISGYDDGTFGPADPVTREQLATMLWRQAGSPEVDQDLDFVDADEVSSFAREAVEWVVSEGVLSGYEDGSNELGPIDFLERCQCALMLMRLAAE